MRKQCVSLIVAAACLFCVLVAPVPTQSADQERDDYELMRVFVDTFEQIERNYVKDVNRRELMEAAIQGMVAKLDPYSSYISPDDLARFNQMVDQEFGGIGIHVSVPESTKRLTVVSPLPGTPAYKAGVRAGDVILEIEGESTEGFTIESAVKLLKGKPGEPVEIKVKHDDAEETEEEITVVRAVIQVPTVLGDRYNSDGSWNFVVDEKHKIGYIRLTHFSRRSGDELRDVLGSLKSDGMLALVLDLRTNPGGLLSQATEIADLFIEKGMIVKTEGRNTPERVWNARKAGTYSGFPMAVLVNRFSASASEIVSACLQDHKRAVVVGERTWGKGSVQNVIELEEGSSALKLTTASYLRPSGKNIHRFPGVDESEEWGVMPNDEFEIKLPQEELREFLVHRRERDVLKKDGSPNSDFEDRQLQKALEHLIKEIGATEAAQEQNSPETEKEDTARRGADNRRSGVHA
jgi:carboxyl-terminal processing protease